MTPQHRSHHIHERIYHADFVKLHLRWAEPMGNPFCLCQPTKHGEASVFHHRRHSTRCDDPLDTTKRERGPESIPNHRVHFGRVQSGTRDLPGSQGVPINRHGFQATDEVLDWEAGIHQGAKDHVPADPGKTVKMELDSHPLPSTTTSTDQAALILT